MKKKVVNIKKEEPSRKKDKGKPESKIEKNIEIDSGKNPPPEQSRAEFNRADKSHPGTITAGLSKATSIKEPSSSGFLNYISGISANNTELSNKLKNPKKADPILLENIPYGDPRKIVPQSLIDSDHRVMDSSDFLMTNTKNNENPLNISKSNDVMGSIMGKEEKKDGAESEKNAPLKEIASAKKKDKGKGAKSQGKKNKSRIQKKRGNQKESDEEDGGNDIIEEGEKSEHEDNKKRKTINDPYLDKRPQFYQGVKKLIDSAKTRKFDEGEKSDKSNNNKIKKKMANIYSTSRAVGDKCKDFLNNPYMNLRRIYYRRSVAFNQKEKILACSYIKSERIELFDLRNPEKFKSFEIPGFSVLAMALDSDRIIFAMAEKVVQLYQLKHIKEKNEIEIGSLQCEIPLGEDKITSLCINKRFESGNAAGSTAFRKKKKKVDFQIVGGTTKGKLVILEMPDILEDKDYESFDFKNNDFQINCVGSYKYGVILVGGTDSTIYLININNEVIIIEKEYQGKHEKAVLGLSFQEKYLVTGSKDQVNIFNMEASFFDDTKKVHPLFVLPNDTGAAFRFVTFGNAFEDSKINLYLVSDKIEIYEFDKEKLTFKGNVELKDVYWVQETYESGKLEPLNIGKPFAIGYDEKEIAFYRENSDSQPDKVEYEEFWSKSSHAGVSHAIWWKANELILMATKNRRLLLVEYLTGVVKKTSKPFPKEIKALTTFKPRNSDTSQLAFVGDIVGNLFAFDFDSMTCGTILPLVNPESAAHNNQTLNNMTLINQINVIYSNTNEEYHIACLVGSNVKSIIYLVGNFVHSTEFFRVSTYVEIKETPQSILKVLYDEGNAKETKTEPMPDQPEIEAPQVEERHQSYITDCLIDEVNGCVIYSDAAFLITYKRKNSANMDQNLQISEAERFGDFSGIRNEHVKDHILCINNDEECKYIFIAENNSSKILIMEMNGDPAKRVSLVGELKSKKRIKNFLFHKSKNAEKNDFFGYLVLDDEVRTVKKGKSEKSDEFLLDVSGVWNKIEGMNNFYIHQQLAVAVVKNKAIIYELEQKKIVKNMNEDSYSITGLTLSGDGAIAYVALGDKNIKMYDCLTGELIKKENAPLEDIVNQMAVTPDGNTLLMILNNGNILSKRVEDTDWRHVNNSIHNVRKNTKCSAFSYDRTLFCLSPLDSDSNYFIFGKILKKIEENLININTRHVKRINCFAFDKSSKHLASGGEDGKVFLYEIKSLYKEKYSAKDLFSETQGMPVESIIFLDEENSVLLAFSKKIMKIKISENDDQPKTVYSVTTPTGNDFPFSCLTIDSSQENMSVICGQKVLIYEVGKGADVAKLSGAININNNISKLAVAPMSGDILVGFEDSTLSWYKSIQWRMQSYSGTSNINCVCLHSNQFELLVADSGYVKLYNINDFQLKNTYKGKSLNNEVIIYSVSFSPNDNYVGKADEEGVTIYNRYTSQLLYTLNPHSSGKITQLAFHPSDPYSLFTAGSGNKVNLTIDFRNKNNVSDAKTLQSHNNNINSLEIKVKGEESLYVLTAGEDGLLFICVLKNNDKETMNIIKLDIREPIYAAVFFGEEKIAYLTKKLRLWAIDDEKKSSPVNLNFNNGSDNQQAYYFQKQSFPGEADQLIICFGNSNDINVSRIGTEGDRNKNNKKVQVRSKNNKGLKKVIPLIERKKALLITDEVIIQSFKKKDPLTNYMRDNQSQGTTDEHKGDEEIITNPIGKQNLKNLTVSTDGYSIYFLSAGFGIAAFNRISTEEITVYESPGTIQINCIDISNDGKFLAYGYKEGGFGIIILPKSIEKDSAFKKYDYKFEPSKLDHNDSLLKIIDIQISSTQLEDYSNEDDEGKLKNVIRNRILLLNETGNVYLYNFNKQREEVNGFHFDLIKRWPHPKLADGLNSWSFITLSKKQHYFICGSQNKLDSFEIFYEKSRDTEFDNEEYDSGSDDEEDYYEPNFSIIAPTEKSGASWIFKDVSYSVKGNFVLARIALESREQIKVYDFMTGASIKTIEPQNPSIINYAKSMPDESGVLVIYSQSGTNYIALFDLISGEILIDLASKHPNDAEEFYYLAREDILFSMDDDSITAYYDTLNNFSHLLSCKEILSTAEEALLTTQSTYKLPLNMQVYPYPNKFSKLNFLILLEVERKKERHSSTKKSKELKSNDSNKLANDAMTITMNHLENQTWNKVSYGVINYSDIYDISTWGYLLESNFDRRITILSKLVDKQLQYTVDLRRHNYLIKDADALLSTVTIFFPTKLSLFLESFLVDTGLTVPLPVSDSDQIPPLQMNSPWPTNDFVVDAFDEMFDNPISIGQRTRVCLYNPQTESPFLSLISEFSVTHPIFKSEILGLIVDEKWESRAKKFFIFDLVKYVIILIIVSGQTIVLFPKRIEVINEIEVFDIYNLISLGIDGFIALFLLTLLIQEIIELRYENPSIKKYRSLKKDDSERPPPKANEIKESNPLRKNPTLGPQGNQAALRERKQIKALSSKAHKAEPVQALKEEEKRESFKDKLVEYLADFWNKIDFLLIFVGFAAVGIDVLLTFQKDLINLENFVINKVLMATFFFISWLRLMSFARGFIVTSYLIRLLSRVFNDMIGFLIILFFLIIGSALTVFILQTTYSVYNIWFFIKNFYFIIIGDFGNFIAAGDETAIINELFFFIFVVFSIVFVIILLNLLIAIIGDSYEKVMALDKMAVVYERLQLIIHSERSYGRGVFAKFWKSSDKGEKEFLMILNSTNSEQDEDVEERNRFKLDELKKMSLKTHSGLDQLNEKIVKTQTGLDELTQKFNTLASQSGFEELCKKVDFLIGELKDMKDKSKPKDAGEIGLKK